MLQRRSQDYAIGVHQLQKNLSKIPAAQQHSGNTGHRGKARVAEVEQPQGLSHWGCTTLGEATPRSHGLELSGSGLDGRCNLRSGPLSLSDLRRAEYGL
ncbi:hypothetical protein NL676_037960 [Syzygium grande]|nr:hypothetical protein NL676_037960 [Syzygium grande]